MQGSARAGAALRAVGLRIKLRRNYLINSTRDFLRADTQREHTPRMRTECRSPRMRTDMPLPKNMFVSASFCKVVALQRNKLRYNSMLELARALGMNAYEKHKRRNLFQTPYFNRIVSNALFQTYKSSSERIAA